MAKAKTVLITGASSGFGKATVLQLLDRGHTVIAALRGGLDRARTLFPNSSRLHAIDLHLDRPETFETAKATVDSHFEGKLDVLINNAGYGLFGALEEQSESQIREQLEVNALAPIFLIRKLLPALRQSQGRIINVSSVFGFSTAPLYGSYCASKYALEAFSEALWHELKPQNIQVAIIEPAGFKTDFAARSLRWAEHSGSPVPPTSKIL